MYTKEQLQELSTEELIELKKKLENDVSKHDSTQLGLKVFLNSCYGMIGNEYSRYFDTRIAEAITVSGQLSIRWIERKLDEYLNRVCGTKDYKFAVAGDTDSIYLSLAPIVKKAFPDAPKEKVVRALDRFCEDRIQPVINKSYDELADYMNSFQQKMVMAREVIADRGLWRAKKNYALNVWNSEGVAYDEPKLKIMGLESVRSSTPEVCRNGIKEVLRLIMTTDEATVQKYIKDFKSKFYKLPISDIAKNTSVKNITKWQDGDSYKSGTPYNVKGAILYNRLVEDAGLTSVYRKIHNGDKVKLVYLKKENPTHETVFAFPDDFPEELGIKKYVNVKLQYEKNFLNPVNSLITLLGWSSERKQTLW